MDFTTIWIKRDLSEKMTAQSKLKPVLLLTGARQTGKSSLLKHLFPKATYVTLDKPLIAEDAVNNPESFLSRYPKPVILDEIQYAPQLFRALKVVVDENRHLAGQFLLTGNQRFPLMKEASESLAGRISIFELDSFSAAEIRHANLQSINSLPQRGGYPELWNHPEQSSLQYYEDYLSTYLERDLRALLNVSSLRTFEKCLRSLALRVGAPINYTDISRDISVSATTVKSWVEVLVASGVVTLLEPWFTNETKRMTQTPKLYFRDNGLLCHLLRVHSANSWQVQAHVGKIWENFVFSELLRYAIVHGTPRTLNFWRDWDGHEIDFVWEYNGQTVLIEAKASQQPEGQEAHFGKFLKYNKAVSTECVIACTPCASFIFDGLKSF